MTVIFYESVEALASTDISGWTERASKGKTLNARKHWLWVYAEYGGMQTNRPIGIRVKINGSEVASDYHTPEISGEYKSFSMMYELDNAVEATLYTASLEYGFATGPQTVLVRRVRLMVMQE